MIKKFLKIPLWSPVLKFLKMLFYLYKDPPECMLDFETVEALILERFQLYSLPGALQNDTEGFNYYDRISHLLMCMIVIDYPPFSNSFMKGELNLFIEKLKVQKWTDIKKQLSEVSDYLESLLQSEDYRKLKRVCLNQFKLMQSIILGILCKCSHSFKKNHKKNCRKYKLILPFTCLLKLVANKEVEINNGKVNLSCGSWNEVLNVIFEFLLQLELTLIENSEDLKAIYESEDDRIRQIIKRFTSTLNGISNKEKGDIKANEIDEKSRYFPPCMANLHQILRKTHRLSYDSRYQYTLFLKDIGLSVNENIFLWESEYQKPHEGSACCHHWKDKDKRYKYQIEHMYGLIGSHLVKTSHSCEMFIKKLQMRMDGGCPFQHLTLKQLENTLPKSVMSLPDVEDIFMYKKEGMPQKSCATYLKCLQTLSLKQRRNFLSDKIHFNKCSFVISPLQFYNIAQNL